MVEMIGCLWRLVEVGGGWWRLGWFNAWENPKTPPHAQRLRDSQRLQTPRHSLALSHLRRP